MKSKLKQYAPIALYISLVAALAAIGIYAVKQKFDLSVQISLGIFILGIASYILLEPQKVREILTGRQARYGSNVLIMSVAFLGIIVVINYLVYNNPRRWDVTENKEHTLAPESIEALNRLPGSVFAQAFYSSNNPTDTAKTLLDNFKNYSKGKFDYKFIDPNKDPTTAYAAKISEDGTIVLKMGEQTEQVTNATETDITEALIRLINPTKRVVYFLTGHGEFSLDSADSRSYSQVAQMLKNKNYTVSSLNLLTNLKIPDDATVVVIAGPTKPLSVEEVGALKAYVDSGKALVYLTEPSIVTGFDTSSDPLAKYLQDNWAIKLDEDIIIDTNSTIIPTSGNLTSFAISDPTQYGDHPISRKLKGIYTILPSARSMTAGTPPTNIALTPLVKTPEQEAWGETDFTALKNGRVTFDSKDISGSLILAIAGNDAQTKGRVVVIGDSEFVCDAYLTSYQNYIYGNIDLFNNSVDWAASQENLINLTVKTAVDRSMLPLEQTTQRLLMIGTVFVLPGAVVVMGIIVWVRRRMRG